LVVRSLGLFLFIHILATSTNHVWFVHPSGDSSFRTDLRALACGNLELAQSEKERLEVLQRADKKNRAKNGGH
jgi:hypothetical protein